MPNIRTDDDDAVLKDGQRLDVRMMMMDAAAKPPTDRSVGVGMNRPGSLPMTDADKQRRHEQQHKSDTALGERWKSPPSSAVGALQVEQARTPAPAPDLAAAYARHDQALEQRWKTGGVA